MPEDVWLKASNRMVAVLRDVPGAGEQALSKLGVRMESEIKKILSEPGSGVVYQKYKPRRRHQASAPGEPPAVDLGKYRASWGWVVEKVGNGWQLLFGTSSELGEWLEFGTTRMEARPHLRVLAERVRGGLAASAFRAAVSDIVRRAAGRTR